MLSILQCFPTARRIFSQHVQCNAKRYPWPPSKVAERRQDQVARHGLQRQGAVSSRYHFLNFGTKVCG